MSRLTTRPVVLLAAFLLMLLALMPEAEAGMLMGKGAGRGVPSGPRRRPWDSSARYKMYKELRDRIMREEMDRNDLPVNNHGPNGLPEPCVGVCYLLKLQKEAKKKEQEKEDMIREYVKRIKNSK